MARPLGGFILPQIEGRRAGTTPRWADIREMAESASRWGSTRSGSSITCCTASDRRACARCLGGLVAALGAGGGHDQSRIWERWSSAPVPKSGAAGQDGRHGRRDQRRPADPGSAPATSSASTTPSASHTTTASAASRRRWRSSAGCFVTARSTTRASSTSPASASAVPRGPRPAGPPIMIGTRGEKMLRLTAKHADLERLAGAWRQPASRDPAAARRCRRSLYRGWP